MESKKTLLGPEDAARLKLEAQLLKACPTTWTRWDSPVIGLDSVAEPEKPTLTMDTQTDPLVKEDKACGTVPKVTTGAQVLLEKEKDTSHEANSPAFVSFMRSATKLMLEELDQELVEFRAEEQASYWDRMKIELKLLHQRKVEFYKRNPAVIENRFPCPKIDSHNADSDGMSVSWDSKGMNLVVGYSAHEGHEGWCRHFAVPVTMWSLRAEHGVKAPLYIIPFDSCAAVVKFHPALSNYVAIGFRSGEVALFDLYPSEKQPKTSPNYALPDCELPGLQTSEFLGVDNKSFRSDRHEFKHNEIFVTVDGGCHNNYLVSLQWIDCDQNQGSLLTQLSRRPSRHFLVTASREGYIGLWSIDRETGDFHMERRYVLLPSCIPSHCLAKGTSRLQLKNMHMLGIVAFDCADPTNFICTTYGSFVFSGTLLSDVEISKVDFTLDRGNGPPIFDPQAKLIFQEQEYISKIIRSPYSVHLYAYVTEFGRIVIRNVQNAQDAVLELYVDGETTIVDIQWSKRPLLLGVAVKTSIILYDLLISQTKAVMTIEHTHLLAGFCFNMTSSDFVAGIDKLGVVVVWKLPSELTKEQEMEMIMFNDFAKGPYSDAFDYMKISSEEDEPCCSEDEAGPPEDDEQRTTFLRFNDDPDVGVDWKRIYSLKLDHPERMAIYNLMATGKLNTDTAWAATMAARKSMKLLRQPEEKQSASSGASGEPKLGTLNNVLEQIESLANPESSSSGLQDTLRNADPKSVAKLVKVRKMKQKKSNLKSKSKQTR